MAVAGSVSAPVFGASDDSSLSVSLLNDDTASPVASAGADSASPFRLPL